MPLHVIDKTKSFKMLPNV